jgi:hypothetical protein
VRSKIKHRLTIKKILAAIALVWLAAAGGTGQVHAQSITKGYGTDETLQRGQIVMQKKDDPNKVVALASENIERMFGVVVNANDSPVTLSDENEKVFVSTVGQFEVLVSDQNGAIKTGEYVTISALNGIGMKADLTQQFVLGKAAANFDGQTGVITVSELKDSAGGTRKVNVGKIVVDLAISKNPQAKSDAGAPKILNKIGQAIAGKNVNPSKIYLSFTIFLITAFIAGATLYAGIRSSVYSIGRNPLSKKSIFRGLAQVVFTSLIIFAVGLIGVYLLLKL